MTNKQVTVRIEWVLDLDDDLDGSDVDVDEAVRDMIASTDLTNAYEIIEIVESL